MFVSSYDDSAGEPRRDARASNLSVQVLLNRRAYTFLVNGRKSHKEWGEQRHANIGLHNDKQKETAEWLHDDNLVNSRRALDVHAEELVPTCIEDNAKSTLTDVEPFLMGNDMQKSWSPPRYSSQG